MADRSSMCTESPLHPSVPNRSRNALTSGCICGSENSDSIAMRRTLPRSWPAAGAASPARAARTSRRLVCRERSIVRGDGGRFTTPPPSRLEARSRPSSPTSRPRSTPPPRFEPPRWPPNRGSTRRGLSGRRSVTRPPTEAASQMKRSDRAATNGAPGGARGPASGTPHPPSHAPSRPPILAPLHAHGLGFGRLGRDERRRRDGNRCRRQPTKQPSTRNRFRH